MGGWETKAFLKSFRQAHHISGFVLRELLRALASVTKSEIGFTDEALSLLNLLNDKSVIFGTMGPIVL